MSDMLKAISPKSDQLNADDLIGGQSKAITITRVVVANTPQQPVTIYFEGDDGKPYKPCKSMSRVLATCWGTDSKNYVGKSLTLFRDDSVVFGGAAVGGLRISHMSDIAKETQIALTVTKGKRAPWIVKPLRLDVNPSDHFEAIETAKTIEELQSAFKRAYELFKDKATRERLVAVKDQRKSQLAQTGGES